MPEQIKYGESINLQEVKGYMTVQEGADATKTSLEEFSKAYQIPVSVPPQTKMKDISKIVPGYDLDKVKESLPQD